MTRPIDQFDNELAAMHELVQGGRTSVEDAALRTAVAAESGVTADRLMQLYPTWSALAENGRA